VLRISVSWLLDIIAAIDELGKVKATTLGIENWYPLFNAENQIQIIFDQSIYSQYLTVSKREGKNSI
jgi:hypothetical protein